jgi:hypothetical protein
MNMTDELERLGKLHKDGVLSDDEFAKAKNKLLNQGERDDSDANRTEDNSLGQAANRYVTLQAVMAVIGVIIFLIFLFGVILPHMPHNNGPNFQFAPI